jgi:tetratricopeptide (TPR) repeat protein/capsular polysaccharide biosynthesis protein
MQPSEMLAKVATYLNNHQWSEAIRQCQDWLQAYTRQKVRTEIDGEEMASVYRMLGKAYEGEGKVTQAIASYQKALQVRPNWVDCQLDLAWLYGEIGETSPAIDRYNRILQQYPHWQEVRYNLAHLLQKQGNLAAACQQYRQVLKSQPPQLSLDLYVRTHYNLAISLQESGFTEAATHSYQQVIRWQPERLNAYNNLGCAWIQLEKYEEAARTFQRALQRKKTPNSSSQADRASLYQNLGKALENLAALNKRQRSQYLGEAAAAYRRTTELQPEKAPAYRHLGKILQQQGWHEKAITLFQKAIARDAADLTTYDRCALSWLNLGKPERAIECWQQIVAREPELIAAYCRENQGMVPQDDLEVAKWKCTRLLADWQNPSANRQEEAIALLAQIYQHIARAMVSYGWYTMGEAYYQTALQLQPHNLDLYLGLGDTLVYQKRFAGAIAAYRMGLLYDATHPQLCCRLGNILAAQGFLDAAIATYQQGNLRSHHETCLASPLPTQSASHRDPAIPFAVHRCTAEWLQKQGYEGCYQHWQTATVNPPAPPSKTTDACMGVNCQSCLGRLGRELGRTKIFPGIYKLSASEKLQQGETDLFIAKIPQGRTWISPQKNSWMVCKAIATITPDNLLLDDLSRSYPGELPGCTKRDRTRHEIFRQNSLPPLETINGTVAVVAGLSGHTYFHWMVDILPRLELLRQSGWSFDWLLTNKINQPFQRETLEKVGIPAKKVLTADRYPHIQAQELLVPSFVSSLGWATKRSLAFLRRTFISQPTPKMPKRIYISRQQAKYRKILNEKEVMEILKPLGFVSITLEGRSVAEQATLFAQAEAIVAPHGGGLTNLAFCRQGTKVIELVSPNYIRHYYWVISQQLGLQHYYLPGKEFRCPQLRQLMYQSVLREDILIEPDTLRQMLQVSGLQP